MSTVNKYITEDSTRTRKNRFTVYDAYHTKQKSALPPDSSRIPVNSKFVSYLENDLIRGVVVLIHRPHDISEKFPYGSYLARKKRRWELRWQLQFKQKPVAPVYFGAELVEKLPRLSITFRTVARIVLALSKKVSKLRGQTLLCNYDEKTGDEENTYFMFPLAQADTVIVTPIEMVSAHKNYEARDNRASKMTAGEQNGTNRVFGVNTVEMGSKLGVRITGNHFISPGMVISSNLPDITCDEALQGVTVKDIAFDTENIYTFAYYSMYCDFVTWDIRNIAGVTGVSISRLIGPQPINIIIKDGAGDYLARLTFANTLISPVWADHINRGVCAVEDVTSADTKHDDADYCSCGLDPNSPRSLQDIRHYQDDFLGSSKQPLDFTEKGPHSIHIEPKLNKQRRLALGCFPRKSFRKMNKKQVNKKATVHSSDADAVDENPLGECYHSIKSVSSTYTPEISHLTEQGRLGEYSIDDSEWSISHHTYSLENQIASHSPTQKQGELSTVFSVLNIANDVEYPKSNVAYRRSPRNNKKVDKILLWFKQWCYRNELNVMD